MTSCIDCGGEIIEGQDHRCHTKDRQFVRINFPGHPLHECVGEVFGTDADGLLHVQAVGSSFSGWFLPANVQPIERGARVLVEVEIRDFSNESMMIAGGWMPVTRIKAIATPLQVE